MATLRVLHSIWRQTHDGRSCDPTGHDAHLPSLSSAKARLRRPPLPRADICQPHACFKKLGDKRKLTTNLEEIRELKDTLKHTRGRDQDQQAGEDAPPFYNKNNCRGKRKRWRKSMTKRFGGQPC